jgi:dynein heavy chain
MDATTEVKKGLERHMGRVHDLVNEVCGVYLSKMRRYVYVTPKSYLSFIDLYKQVYKTKYDGIDVEERNIVNGLDKLKEASEGVEVLKIDLKAEDVKLKDATEKTDKLLKEVEIENKKAKEKADEVNIVAENCVNQKNTIMEQKEQADKDLQKALPFLRKAESAVDMIKPKDIGELKTSNRPVDTTKLIMDTIHILFQRHLDPVKPKGDGGMYILKQSTPFVADSYEGANGTKSTLSSANFLKDLLDFSNEEKDNINEETIELLHPYLTLKTPKDEDIYTPEVAGKSSSALIGMSIWTAAMSDYHKQSKIVKPKLRLLEIKMGELKEAETNLANAQAEL